MGKYKYIIYETYPSKIYNKGEFWALTLKLAHRKVKKLANNRFFIVNKI